MAAGTTGSIRKTVAQEKLLEERIQSLEKRLRETMRAARQQQPRELKVCLAHSQARSAAVPRLLRWRGCLPDGEQLGPSLNPAQPYTGCKAEKGRGRNRLAIAIAAPRSAQQYEWTDASRPCYDDSRTARRGQEDAWRLFQNPKRGEMGTGARGAPVPEVGL